MEWIIALIAVTVGLWKLGALKPSKRGKARPTHSSRKGGNTKRGTSKPAPLPVDLPPDDFASVATESRWFVDPLPRWLKQAAEQHLSATAGGGQPQKITTIRGTGEELSNDEKRALGVRANAKLGRDYVDALSEVGKSENPLGALETCIHRARGRRARKRDLKQAAEWGAGAKLEVLAANDERDCQAVRKISGTAFSLENVPRLPLDGCDALYCRCLYQIKPGSNRS
jgi:hypothetical protein